MKFLSVCSGIEAASVAWKNWEPVAFSEIEPFPCAVLKRHYPDVANWGDMTKFKEWPDAAVDVLVGGTPCQSFSVAGLRKGLDDPRGNLMLTYLAIAAKYRPAWVVWENVPGVLSSGGGADFASLLRGLGELGYGWAYRVLDAQYFGVAQRRRRVFVVGHLGDWHRAAAVLFERHSLSGNPAPSRKAREGTAEPIKPRAENGRWWDGSNVAGTLTKQNANGAQRMPDKDNFGAVLIKQATYGCDVTHPIGAKDNGMGVAMPFRDPCPTPTSKMQGSSGWAPQNEDAHLVGVGPTMQVRRLTPRECERLQGFPDDYTLIPWRGKEAPDGPRYKALGNSMAVPVMAWIGQRIAQVAAISAEQAAA